MGVAVVRTRYWLDSPDHYTWWLARPEIADGDFFAFVEETDTVSAEGAVGPDGEPIDLVAMVGPLPKRFRMNGVGVLDFFDIMENFETLDPDPAKILPTQRKRRRDDLQEHLAQVQLPTLDLYTPPEHHDLPMINATLTPGSWHLLGVRRRRFLDHRLPVFVGDEELPPSPYRPGSLEVLASIPPDLLFRLRAIFSLAHVGDAEIGPAGIGERGPPPPDDDDPLKVRVRPRRPLGLEPEGA